MENNYTEAPASITLTLKTPKGFEALYTVRDTDAASLLNRMANLEVHIVNSGYTPYTRYPAKNDTTVAKKEFPAGPACDSCKSPTNIVEGFSKKNNKPYKMIKCSNPVCKWVVWL